MSDKPLIARLFLWKRFSSFTYLNITQFLVTLNDGIFRFLVAFSLIDKLGTNQSGTILFVSGVLFVTPFLIFSMPAGEMADKYPKQKVITWTTCLEMLVMIYGIYAMAHGSIFNAYAALFLVAVQSAIFLPSKYAILPEIVKPEEISKANGYMTLATYLAIVLGTFLASFFAEITGRNYTKVAFFCFIIAAFSFITSLQIEKTFTKNPTKTIKALFFIQVFRSLKLANQFPHLLLTVLASACFLYTASFTQLNVISFGIQSLHLSDVQTGYVFLVAALGIGIGSIIVALVSGKNAELGISIWGAFGTGISYILLFAFSKSLWVSTLMILSLGVHGGLFIVPLDAFIQIASPEKDRGEIIAAANFLGFVGVLLSALSIGLFNNVLHLSAAEGYLYIGILTLTISIIITLFLPEYVSRILAVTVFRAFYHISSKNQPETAFYESVLVIGKKYSLLKLLSIIVLYPRVSFIHFVKKRPSKFLLPFYLLLHTIPISMDKNEFQQDLAKALDKKMPLGLFLEPKFCIKDAEQHKQTVEQLFAALPIPRIFFDIEKWDLKKNEKSSINFFKISKTELQASFSDKETLALTWEQAYEKLENLGE